MPLHAPYDQNNIFAKILAGDIPCAKVYEDDNVLSFMDAFPQARGHTLIIPKTACRNILDAPADVLANLLPRVQMIAKAVEAALQPEGLQIKQFNGTAGGQTVFHLHMHIIPCYADGIPKAHASEQADPEKLAELANQIKSRL